LISIGNFSDSFIYNNQVKKANTLKVGFNLWSPDTANQIKREVSRQGDSVDLELFPDTSKTKMRKSLVRDITALTM
jgi:hypothetical protein